MILVVAGSRSIRDKDVVFGIMSQFIRMHTERRDLVIMHGGASGVDALAQTYADVMDIKTDVRRPDYSSYASKHAPIERNKTMAEDGDALLAIWDGESNGTRSTIEFGLDEKLSPVSVHII